jgi:hypothetical protein
MMSHSHNSIADQPDRCSDARMRRSRLLLALNLAFQKVECVFGTAECLGQPCQKQPCTRIATRLPGNAMSARPAGVRQLSRYPVQPAFLRATRASVSGRVSRPRFPCMVRRTAGESGFGFRGSVARRASGRGTPEGCCARIAPWCRDAAVSFKVHWSASPWRRRRKRDASVLPLRWNVRGGLDRTLRVDPFDGNRACHQRSCDPGREFRPILRGSATRRRFVRKTVVHEVGDLAQKILRLRTCRSIRIRTLKRRGVRKTAHQFHRSPDESPRR